MTTEQTPFIEPVTDQADQTNVDRNRLITSRAGAEELTIGHSTFLAHVQNGRLPKPIKLGPRTSRWLLGDILDFKARLIEESRGET